MADCANKQSLQASLFWLCLCLSSLLPLHFDPIFQSFFLSLLQDSLRSLSPHLHLSLFLSLSALGPLIEPPPAHRIHLSACDRLRSSCQSLSLPPSLSRWRSPTIHKAYLMLARALSYGLFVQLPWECQTLEGRKAADYWVLCEPIVTRRVSGKRTSMLCVLVVFS